MMKVYICGPMRSIPFLNFPAFDKASELLKQAGHEPISPADIDREFGFEPTEDGSTPPHFCMKKCVKRDIEAITDCDAMVVLDGWQQSKGAYAEVAVARWLDIPVFNFKEFIQ